MIYTLLWKHILSCIPLRGKVPKVIVVMVSTIFQMLERMELKSPSIKKSPRNIG